MNTLTLHVATTDRLDRAVPALSDLSRRRVRLLISEGAVYVNGKRCKVASRTVMHGSKLVVHLRPAPPAPELDILFQDEDIVVVNKPAGLSANETETSPRPSVVRTLGPDMKLVHRLDLDTTGTMVVARSDRAAQDLSVLFRDREVHKRYLAVAMGTPPEGWVDAALGADPRRPRARAVREDGRPARTEVSVLGAHDGLSAVALTLETGRTHQIRVHLSLLGTPILGDTHYGAKASVTFEGEAVTVARPLLHAAELTFTLFGIEHHFEAPLPEDFSGLWSKLTQA